MPFSVHVLDTYVAPGLSGFADADILDLRGEFSQAEHWQANYHLNSLLRGSFTDGFRQLALGFIRRVQYAFAAYHAARDATLDYLSRTANGEQPLRLYWTAVHEWEAFVLDMQMATILYRKLADNTVVFEKGDGSSAQQLYDAANDVKHPNERLVEGTLPLWVLADGLHTVSDILVGYGDAAEMLRQMAHIAAKLQDPQTLMSDATS